MSKTSADNGYQERTILSGIFLGSIAYGVHLTLFIRCMHHLTKKKKSRLNWFFVVYLSLLFLMGSVGNATNIKLADVLWVDERDFPGGPAAYFATGNGGVYNLTCNVIYIINSWFQDGILVWRFWVFFARQGRWYFAVLPGLMFLSIIGLSLLLIIRLCSPGISLWSTISIDLAIPYWSISIALNITITACIVARLLSMRYQVRKLIPGCAGIEYISITSMLIESAALYSSNGLIFLITYAVNSPIQNLALPVLGQTQSIAPLLIILRVLQGRAWSSSALTTFDCGSGLRFNNTTITSQFSSDDDLSKVESGVTDKF